MELIDTFFNADIFLKIWPLLLNGLWLTLGLATLSVPLAAAIGLAVAMAYHQHHKWLNRLLIAYVDCLRAFPPLVLLIFIFYGCPFIGLQFNDITATVLALVLNGSSYYAEIFRAGLESVPRGQEEAARSAGLSAPQTMAHVLVPQGVRNVMPDLASNTLELIKQTSIASAVALQELLRAAQIGQGLYYNPTPLVAAALVYFVLLWPLVRAISRMQKPVLIPR